MAIKNLLFIDTNIWLDFYRVRNQTGLKLLGHAEALSEQLIVTYQLESEFKNNRQAAILEGMQELNKNPQISRPGIFSDAQAAKMMAKGLKDVEKRMKGLRGRLIRALENPTVHDPVYKVCQRVFHKKDALALRRDMPIRRAIRRLAYRRFLHGCPPRKRSDTSIGDAFNWEWMVHCAKEQKAGLVIVTRDTDYGASVDGTSYINDHLRHEFSDRVSRKRDLLLYPSLSDALKLFEVAVTPQEEQAEKELTSTRSGTVPLSSLLTWNEARRVYGDSVFEALKALDLAPLGITNDLVVKGAEAASEEKAIPVPEASGNLPGHPGPRRSPSK